MMAAIEQVVGYVPGSMKDRLRKIKEADRRLSESRVVEESLANWLPRIEEKLGLPQSRRPKVPRG
jgi:hypothetical protein